MWASAIVAILKAVPAVRDIYLQTVDLYFMAEQRADNQAQIEIEEEREAILSALSQPGMTDANRKSLRRRLISLSRL